MIDAMSLSIVRNMNIRIFVPPIGGMFSWALSKLFPPSLAELSQPGKSGMQETLRYQYRLSRTEGCEPSRAIVGCRISKPEPQDPWRKAR